MYRCQSCGDCPVRGECTGDRRGRSIEKGPHHEAVVRQVEKQKQPQKAQALNRRGQIVERLFGQIKAREGFRRWTVSGLEKVRAQWALLCTVMNLKKLYQQWVKGNLQLQPARAGSHRPAPAA